MFQYSYHLAMLKRKMKNLKILIHSQNYPHQRKNSINVIQDFITKLIIKIYDDLVYDLKDVGTEKILKIHTVCH